MKERKRSICSMVLLVSFVAAFLYPPTARGAEDVPVAIAEAKAAIEQARQAGAEKKAPAELSQARAWMAQAEKKYDESQSILSRTMKLVTSNEERSREIVYLATMARAKAMIAEAKTKRVVVMDELAETLKDLADYRTSLEVLNKKSAEAEKAKAVQAKAEAELKSLEEAKRKAAEFEESKRKELAQAQFRAAELETLKQKELEQARLIGTRQAAEREKELGEAKLKSEQMALAKERENAEMKAREEKAAAEREKMAALEQKMAGMEREKAMLADAAKIPQSTVRMADGEMVISLLAINLFSPKNELHDQGKALLNKVGAYLKKYPTDRIAIRSYTDGSGKAATNKALSEKRAQKVKEYLAAYQNIPAAGITTEGLGPDQPVASNATDAGRALNRRVEISIPIGG